MDKTVKGYFEPFIICLDDDKGFLNSLKFSLLNKFGDKPSYNMLFLNDPVEALKLISELVKDKEEIALLLTDQMMPNMNGIDFLKEAKKIVPDSIRVLLTGYAGMDSAITAINEGLLDKYLTKPISDIEDFVITLKHLLNEFHLKSTVDAQQRIILDLYNFSNSLNSYDNLDLILEHTVSFAQDTLKSERIYLLILENGELVIRASSGIPKDIAERISIQMGDSIEGKVFKEKGPVLVQDIEQVGWLKDGVDSDFESFITFPMIFVGLNSSDIPLGIINVGDKTDGIPFSEHDLKALSFIANTASIAIKNQQNRIVLEKTYFNATKALIVALEARDKYTKGHSIRVMEYAESIAIKLGLEEKTVKNIRDAAILHDIGKIGVRDSVLLKPGRLSREEAEHINKHPEISEEIIKPISFLKEILPIVRHHHEKFDGSGYPDKLRGDNIPIGARIMAVADTYDAMTSHRPYRKSLHVNVAVSVLKKEAGRQLDPELVEVFLECLKTKRVGVHALSKKLE